MLHVELRERISTFRLCSSLKNLLASSATNRTFFGLSKIAAATARQKSTSKPDQLPLSSGFENPGRPVLTPHRTASRRNRPFQGLGIVSFPYATAAAPIATATPRPIRRPARNVPMECISRNHTAGNHLRSADYRSGFCRTITLVPTGTRSYRVDHVGIDQPEAAGRDASADRLRLIGAVDAVDRGAEIKRAGAERVARAAGHEARQIGLARDHLRRRRPVGPLRLAGDLQQTLTTGSRRGRPRCRSACARPLPCTT